MIPKSKRIRITKFHKDDAFSENAKYIGLEGTFTPEPPHKWPGYYSGHFNRDGCNDYWLFLGVRYVKL